MEVSAATDALLRKLRIEQRKLQQNIHFPDGVDAEHHQRGRQNDHQQQQDEEERQRRNQQQQQNLENERERKYRSDNEAHLLLEIESLHDRIRNLESSLQYERERHQQTRELLRVALKPPADDQEKAHKTYHDHHSGAFMVDGPNVRGDDMASILVGAASPGSRIGDVSVHERESVQPFRAYQNYRPSNNYLRHQKDGIRLASSPFPAEGSVLGAHTPDQLPPHYDRYEIYSSPSSTTPGRQSASKAAKMIYQKAHQLEHSPRESRAVLSDYQQYQQQQQQQNYRGDVNAEGEQFFYDHQQHQNNFHDDDVDRRTTASGTGRSRHMTPTPSRASSTPGGGRGGVGNRRAGSATPSSTRLRPFGTGEKRFAPISVFGEQALHRSMYEEGTPRSQVRQTQSSDHKFMRHGGMRTSSNSGMRKRAGTPTMTTLRSPAMMR